MLERVQRGDSKQALDLLMQARGIQKSLVDDFRGNVDFNMDLAWTLQHLAEMHLFLAADAESDEVRNEHLRHASEIAMEGSMVYDTLDHSNPRVVRGMAMTRVLRATALLAADPVTAARKAWEGMEYLDTPLTKTNRNQDDFFTLALGHACLGRHEDSLQAFGSAVLKGSNTVDRFQAHARLGLRPLAEDPRYQPQWEELIATVQRRVSVR
jgi:hypothetical protein